MESNNIESLLNEITLLKEENNKLKNQLKIYLTPQKEYYEKNKEEINEKAKERLKKLASNNPEKLKEYRRRAYLKQKDKKTQLQVENR
jgi:hypothetical protein